MPSVDPSVDPSVPLPKAPSAPPSVPPLAPNVEAMKECEGWMIVYMVTEVAPMATFILLGP